MSGSFFPFEMHFLRHMTRLIRNIFHIDQYPQDSWLLSYCIKFIPWQNQSFEIKCSLRLLYWHGEINERRSLRVLQVNGQKNEDSQELNVICELKDTQRCQYIFHPRPSFENQNVNTSNIVQIKEIQELYVIRVSNVIGFSS